MKISDWKTVYFLGIGGIGMSALAKYFLNRNISVCGYDLTPSPLTKELETLGAQIHYEENPNLIPQNTDIVIYTPAIPPTHLEFVFFKENHTLMLKRSQILGLLTKDKYTFAVAGTHGKTTNTSMIAQLISGKEEISAFIGGIAKNFNNNFVDHPKSQIMVVEADEFDRSFLTLYPDIALVTSMDADHLDIYGTHEELRKAFIQFANQIKPKGHLIVNQSIASYFNRPKYCYGLSEDCDFYAKNIIEKSGKYSFDFYFKKTLITGISLQVPGKYNMENAVGAAAAAFLFGIEPESIKKQLGNFKGVARRFDYQIESDNLIYIDDYAHHPKEIKTFLTALRISYPNQKITVIFQPHLFSRTQDFMDEFADSLTLCDELILLPIYPARERAEDFKGINSEALSKRIPIQNKHLIEKSELINYLKNHRPQILVTIGAGDIDRFVPKIKELYQKL